jgi:tetratricopeptide (TPR) repeat protein
MAHDDTRPLTTPATTPFAGAGAPAGDGVPRGTRIGPFVVEDLLGRGGMGEVYRAMQLEPFVRTVALKLIRDRRMGSRETALFEVERQVLAQMSHPAIAHVYDAGATADGQPWFAMEYVEGLPLTHWCNRRRLGLRERLALFVRVCRGVQHAHQKGVIHRDLKPGNILVTEVDGQPQPKIIDFGIAAAAVRCLATESGERMGTPEYMSPEQAGEGPLDIDTRSDVYALGIVLHELLVGRRPDGSSESGARTPEAAVWLPSAALARTDRVERDRLAALHGEPVARLLQALRSELDWVVAKATRRDRNDRYDSAALLADDVERFLSLRPVGAVPVSRAYTIGRFIRRHRLGIAAATGVAFALVAGLAASLYGFWQADQQRRIAEQRSAELARVSAFQQSMLEDVDLAAMGARLADSLRGQYRRALGRSESDAERRAALLAAFDGALAATSPTEAARRLIGEDVLSRARTAIARDFADQSVLAGDLEQSLGELYEALGLFEDARAVFEPLAAAREASLGAGDPRTLQARMGLGFALNRLGQTREAEAMLRATLDAADRAGSMGSSAAIGAAHVLALNLGDQGRPAEAVPLLLDALERSVRLHGIDGDETLTVRTTLGIVRIRLGEREAALKEFAAVAAARRARLGAEHPDTLSAIANHAGALGTTGRYDEALALQREVWDTNRRVRGAEHPVTLGDGSNLGSTLMQLGRVEEAADILRGVLEARRRVLGEDHPQTLRTGLNLASTLARLDAVEEAIELQSDVFARRARTLGDEHPDTLAARLALASLLHTRGDLASAEAEIRVVRQLRAQRLPERHPDRFETDHQLAEVLHEQGRSADAVPLARAALAGFDEVAGAEHPATLGAATTLWSVLRATGDAPGATAVRARWLDPLLARDASTLSGTLRLQRERIARTLQETDAR